MSVREFRSTWRRAWTAELCWVDANGCPNGIAVTPLLRSGTPCVALPYCHLGLAREIAAAGRVGAAVTDRRSLGGGTAGGLVAYGTVALTEDRSGQVFLDELLDQELVKYPPSRVLADSVLDRRENWWWTPRLLLELTGVDEVLEQPPRSAPVEHALLLRAGSAGVRIRNVTLHGASSERVSCTALDGAELPCFDTGTLFGHDYTAPDFERWESWRLFGDCRADGFVVRSREGNPTRRLTPLGLLERLRRERRIARACRDGIARAERGG
ncbi:hypothetical protein CEP50_07265 [Actinopolyspora mortivallis]|uniref:Uncharacterized protein n=1 Tax=Actinopolyspora mortivallis TaxID=33906 RepID=A0A2T0GY07_ACTMO|nr:hypothetical protein CEP50_07265 [Actinopolyspora mortivallis]